MKVPQSSRLLIMCDDCLSQWNSPLDSQWSRRALTDEVRDVVFATAEEVREAGWEPPADPLLVPRHR